MTVRIIKANTVQIMDYYPFGLMWEKQDVTSTDNLKWHHGKELQENEFAQQGKSLDLEDFGARMYDPILGRWWSVDPLAEKFLSLSPYNGMGNNPIFFIDPNGMENIPALIWAAKNMANKEIPFGQWYGGQGGWTFQKGVVPTETVCYESCWTAYMNGADAKTMESLKTGFSTAQGGFRGRSHEYGGMNWFKNGDGTDRRFETDINKGELGDIVFMGEPGGMEGHAVLLASGITAGTTTVDGKERNTISFYVLTTSSDTDPGNYGGELITWTQQENGDWAGSHGGYTFRGFGQMTNVDSTEEQKNQAAQLIKGIQK
jgi:RHS repeat-associated protein